MPTMTKRVNVRATVAVRNTNPPIYGTYKNIIMTTGDILKCLTKRATVDEILPDGSTIRLNYKNYYTDNGAGLSAKSDEKIITPKHSPVVKKATPVENVKVDTDISFNESSITNTDDDNEESKTSTEATADIAENEPAILVTESNPEDDSNAEHNTVENNIESVKAPVTENAVEDNKIDKISTEKTPIESANATPKASPKKKPTSSKKKK